MAEITLRPIRWRHWSDGTYPALHSSHRIHVEYLPLESRRHTNNKGGIKRPTIHIDWLPLSLANGMFWSSECQGQGPISCQLGPPPQTPLFWMPVHWGLKSQQVQRAGVSCHPCHRNSKPTSPQSLFMTLPLNKQTQIHTKRAMVEMLSPRGPKKKKSTSS